MSESSLFTGTIAVAERALDLRARRHELISANIANADTPGYKAFDLLVDQALADQSPSGGSLPLQRTSVGHLTAQNQPSGNPVPQKVNLSSTVTLRGDGNTVDMDREMAQLSANQLQYKISAQILAKKFQSLRNVIQGGKR